MIFNVHECVSIIILHSFSVIELMKIILISEQVGSDIYFVIKLKAFLLYLSKLDTALEIISENQ